MFKNLNFQLSNKIVFYLGGFGLFFAGIGYYFGFLALPDIVDNKIWEMKVLKEGTDQWEMFMKMPFPFTFKVHIFNITNPDDVMQGAKPIVEDVGPFVYRLFKWKSEVKWNTSEEISYNEYQKYEFDKEASGKNREDDVVTVLNIPYLSMLEKVEEVDSQMAAMVDPVMPFIFREIDGPLMKVRVGDFMFKGLKICEHEGKGGDILASMACKEMSNRVKSKETRNMRIEGDTIMFANLHYKNNSHLGRYTIKSGLKKKEDAGILIKYDEKSYIEKWNGETSSCNRIRGVTTIFPTKINRDMTFDAFAEDICRSMTLSYQQPETVKGLSGFRFALKNDSFDYSKKENQCFCTNRTKKASPVTGCMKNGLCDLSTCSGMLKRWKQIHVVYMNDLVIRHTDPIKQQA